MFKSLTQMFEMFKSEESFQNTNLDTKKIDKFVPNFDYVHILIIQFNNI